MNKIEGVYLSLFALLIIILLVLSSRASVFTGRQEPDLMKDDEQRLLAILHNKETQEKDREVLVQAIERLGEMRSVAAIDDLISLIAFKRTLESKDLSPLIVIDTEHPVTPLSVYPATGALFHIGKPSLSALIRLIETSDANEVASQNAVYTVMAIFREDPQAGVQHLQSAADQAVTPEASKNLLRAVARARTLFR